MRARARRLAATALTAGVGLSVAAGSGQGAPPEEEQPPGVAKLDTLRRAAPQDIVVGTAVAGGGHHENRDYPPPFAEDETYRELLAAEFSSVTPENQLKWEFVHPEPDSYRFGPADAIVEFAEANGQQVRGHALLWHSQNPAWLEEGDYSDEELRAILKDHIQTVVGRYAGRIEQWDVANEIFDDAGNWREQDNIWIRELGTGIVADAFRWAHEADPEAALFLNDYNVEGPNAKSDAYYALVQRLLADGVPVHGFGAQAHLGLQYGYDTRLQANLQRFDDLGLQTAITELDIRMVLDGTEPTEEQLAEQASRFRQTLQACLNVEGCQSFTVWGFNDMHSWVPGTFEGQGAASIMWPDYSRKPAYEALQEELLLARPGGEALLRHHPAYRD